MYWLLQELRRSGRRSRRSLASTVGIVVTLALGTGLNFAVLAVAYGVLGRPLPYRDPSQLVIIQRGALLPELDEWRARLRTVDGIAGFATADHSLRGIGEPRIVRAAFVSSGFFEILGVSAMSGQLPTAHSEGQSVILSQRLALRAGQEASGLLHSMVSLADGVFTVAGVMPVSVSIPSEDIDLWLPATAAPAVSVLRKDDRRYTLIARLKPGTTLQNVRDDATRVARELTGGQSAGPSGPPVDVVTVETQLLGAVRPVLLGLATGASLVLLIACANVAGLLLNRAITREREIALLRALGAPWRSIIGGFFIDALVLVSAGSIGGLIVAATAVRLLRARVVGLLPRAEAIFLDLPVMATAAAVVLFVAVLCTIAPGLHSLRRSLGPLVRYGSRYDLPHRRRATAFLVVVQIAMSVVLLISSGLLARTMTRLLNIDLGLNSTRALTLKLTMGDRTLLRPGEHKQFVDELLEQVQALPGVESAGLGSSLPPHTSQVEIGIRVVEGPRDESRRLGLVATSGRYLEAIGARLLKGQLAGEGSVAQSAPQIVLSRSAAAHLVEGRDPIGLDLTPMPGTGGQRPRVIAVVEDVKFTGLVAPVAGAIYVPWQGFPLGTMYLVVRTKTDPLTLAPAVRSIVRRLNPAQPVSEARSLKDVVSSSVADRRMHAMVTLSFALIALAITVAGVTAVLGQRIAARRQELAIRCALGASRSDTVRLVMAYGLKLAAIGVAAGLALAGVAGRGLVRYLFGISEYDPITFLGAALVTSLTAVIACAVPAIRASVIQPGRDLRAD